MIYFDKPTQQRLVGRLYDILTRRGCCSPDTPSRSPGSTTDTVTSSRPFTRSGDDDDDDYNGRYRAAVATGQVANAGDREHLRREGLRRPGGGTGHLFAGVVHWRDRLRPEGAHRGHADFQLPSSTLNAQRAQAAPLMFADTVFKALLDEVLRSGRPSG